MKPIVDKEKCIGCGFCIGVAPEVFRFNEENRSEVIEGIDYSQFEDKMKQAQEGCPVQAISIE